MDKNRESVKLIRLATTSTFLNKLLKGQLAFLNKYFTVIAMSSPGKELEEVKIRENINVVPVNLRREISPFQDLFSLLKLIRQFKRIRPKIVHTSTPKAGLLGMLAAKFVRVPYRIHTETGLRFETTKGLKRKILIFTHKLTYKAANVIIAESEGVKQLIKKNNLTTKTIYKIGNGNINGIDLHYWSKDCVRNEEVNQIKDKYHLHGKFVFIFIGRLVKDKGVQELVFSFLELKKKKANISLFLLGDFEQKLNPLASNVISLIKNHPDIYWLGFKDDIRPFLKVANVLILPSHREGFPNVVLQAMALEVPCIVTPVNGAVEVIENNRNGFIVPFSDIEALQQAMLNCSENPELMESFSSNTRNVIESKFSQVDFYQALLNFYMQLLEK